MSFGKIPFSNAPNPSILTIAAPPSKEKYVSRMSKGLQIDVVSNAHNEVENIAIHLSDLQGAFEILGLKAPAKKLQKEADRLYDVARKLLVITECLLAEDAKK